MHRNRRAPTARSAALVLALFALGCNALFGGFSRTDPADSDDPPQKRMVGPVDAGAKRSYDLPEWRKWYKWHPVGACRQFSAIDPNGPFVGLIYAVESEWADPRHYRIQCDGSMLDIACIDAREISNPRRGEPGR